MLINYQKVCDDIIFPTIVHEGPIIPVLKSMTATGQRLLNHLTEVTELNKDSTNTYNQFHHDCGGEQVTIAHDNIIR